MNNGRVYVEKAYEIPEGSRTSKGRNIFNFLDMQKSEKVAALIPVNLLIQKSINFMYCERRR